MAVASRPFSNKWKDRGISPERTKVWAEPTPKLKTERKVPVVYYLSRDGHLEHPHFMEVPIASNEGLYLKDVINRLNSLRGKAMASMYSWSSKRSYKHGFVWHDLSENDFIYPAHGQEYVLKGSELVPQETLKKSLENNRSGEECDFQVVGHRRNQSWSAIDLHEYKVYKAECTGEYAGKAADAATQTDDKRRRRTTIQEEEAEVTELNREEISPPPSSSSPETLETLIQSDGSLINVSRSDIRNQTVDIHPSGRIKAASTVLMQLISCGSFSVKDYGKDQRLSFMSQYKNRLPRGPPNQDVPKEVEDSPIRRIQLEEKEYFSGSLIETKKNEFAALKRSSSYNADRSTRLELKEEEIDGVRAKCIPRKPKTASKKEISNAAENVDASESAGVEGSK